LNLVEETANYKFYEEVDEENDYKFYKAICAKKTGIFVQTGYRVSLNDGTSGLVAGLARSPYRAIEAFIYNPTSEKLSVLAFGRVSKVDSKESNTIDLGKANTALIDWKKKNGSRKHKRKDEKKEDIIHPTNHISDNNNHHLLNLPTPIRDTTSSSSVVSHSHHGLKRSFKEIILQEINKGDSYWSSENNNERESMIIDSTDSEKKGKVERESKFRKLERITNQLIIIQQNEISKLEEEMKEKHKREKERLADQQLQETQELYNQRHQLQLQHKQQLSILHQMVSKAQPTTNTAS